jgi:hemoglobin
LPFAIGESERNQWMICMNRALEEVVENGLIRVQLGRSFAQIADFMRNKEG